MRANSVARVTGVAHADHLCTNAGYFPPETVRAYCGSIDLTRLAAVRYYGHLACDDAFEVTRCAYV